MTNANFGRGSALPRFRGSAAAHQGDVLLAEVVGVELVLLAGDAVGGGRAVAAQAERAAAFARPRDRVDVEVGRAVADALAVLLVVQARLAVGERPSGARLALGVARRAHLRRTRASRRLDRDPD